MKEGRHIFFIDGDALISHLPKDGVCYTSALSSDLDLRKIELSPSKNTEINYQAWDEVIHFYNTHKTYFGQFEKNEGFNLWFYLNFRLYFEWRNHKLRIATLKAFLNEHSEGVIISSDRQLESVVASHQLQVRTTNGSKKSKLGKLRRIVQELAYIFFAKGSKSGVTSETVIISKAEDLVNNRNRRFHLLEDQFETISVRSVFQVANPLIKSSKAFDESLNINRILSQYIPSISSIVNFRKFNSSLNRLFSSLSSVEDSDVYLLQFIKKHRSAYIVYHLIYRSFLKYLKDAKIRNILVSDENSPQSRAIIDAAKKFGIKSFAFQHGTIHDLHPAYIFGKYEHEVPLPTMTFVWGAHYAELLKKSGGYRNDQVHSSGRLPVYVDKSLNRHIDRNRKIIVFATQPQRNPALRKRQLEDVMMTAQKLSQSYQLVIRPHPREKDDSYFIDIASAIGVDNFLIDRTSDLISHFECCHILITSFSTVGLEFISYHKPLLILDYLKEDLIGYISNGVGIPVYDRSGLFHILSNEHIEVNSAAYDTYLEAYNRPNDNIVEEVKHQILNPDL